MDSSYSYPYTRRKDPFFYFSIPISISSCTKEKKGNLCMSFLSFFSVTSPGHQGYLGATIVSTGLTDWQALGIELCLTFVITLVYLVITIFISNKNYWR